MKAFIIFDNNLKQYILDIFGKTVNSSDNIVEKDSGEEVLTARGDKIAINDFAGIKRGSEIFLEDDLPTAVEFYEEGNLWSQSGSKNS